MHWAVSILFTVDLKETITHLLIPAVLPKMFLKDSSKKTHLICYSSSGYWLFPFLSCQTFENFRTFSSLQSLSHFCPKVKRMLFPLQLTAFENIKPHNSLRTSALPFLNLITMLYWRPVLRVVLLSILFGVTVGPIILLNQLINWVAAACRILRCSTWSLNGRNASYLMSPALPKVQFSSPLVLNQTVWGKVIRPVERVSNSSTLHFSFQPSWWFIHQIEMWTL